jgi:hypothetical protein
MSGEGEASQSADRWEKLYKEALFEANVQKMPRRIELAKHAILDRLEDGTCSREKQNLQAGELAALRNAHRTLRVLEQLYFNEQEKKLIA